MFNTLLHILLAPDGLLVLGQPVQFAMKSPTNAAGVVRRAALQAREVLALRVITLEEQQKRVTLPALHLQIAFGTCTTPRMPQA